jgi:hypothetical protein
VTTGQQIIRDNPRRADLPEAIDRELSERETLARELLAALKATVPEICARCAMEQDFSRERPEFHAVKDRDGIEIGYSTCRSAAERALIARCEKELT